MKDLIEVRFTVAAKEINIKAATKAATVLAKFFEDKIDRLAEAFTKAVEEHVRKEYEEKE